MLTTLRSSAIHQLKHIKLLQTAIIVEDCYLLTFTLIETVTALFAPPGIFPSISQNPSNVPCSVIMLSVSNIPRSPLNP